MEKNENTKYSKILKTILQFNWSEKLCYWLKLWENHQRRNIIILFNCGFNKIINEN